MMPSWRLFGAVVLVTFVTLLTIEVAMRLSAFVLLQPQIQANKNHSDDDKKIRILAIGESTTADLLAQENGVSRAWPRQLEEQLNERGYAVRVYNEGRPSVGTFYFVKNLQDLLEVYRPHIVISMIGVNEGNYSYLHLRHGPPWYLQLKVVKLAIWGRLALQTILFPKRQPPRAYTERKDEIQKSMMARDFARADRIVAEVPLEFRGWAYADLATFCWVYSKEPERDRPACHPFALKAYALDPMNTQVISRSLRSARYMKDDKNIRSILEDVSKNNIELDDISLQELSYHSDPLADQLIEKHNLKRGLVRAKEGAVHPNMQLLHQMIVDFGAKHVIMQYPTLSAEPLPARYGVDPDSSDIFVVENESNFKKALETDSYDKLFVDRFQQTWGHTTVLGHRMIAEAARAVLLQNREIFKLTAVTE